MELTRDGLVVRWLDRDADQTGDLEVEARFDGFAGVSAASFWDEHLLRFADDLGTYPLGDQRFQLSGGYSNGPGGSRVEHVGLTVHPIGVRGQVGVIVHLAVRDNHVRHEQVTPSEVRVEVLTSYEALGRFASELRHLVAGEVDEASLDAEIAGLD
jgi:hypothetical protein